MSSISWMFFDAVRGKKPSAMGFCIGAVVGLVAITPGAGFVTIPHALFIGVVASVISNVIAHWRTSTSLDDTLDVFPCHGVGGMVGMLMTGIFATGAVNSVVNKAVSPKYNPLPAAPSIVTKHLIALVLVSGFAFGVSFALLKVTDLIMPLRATAEDELEGLDKSQHDESLVF